MDFKTKALPSLLVMLIVFSFSSVCAETTITSNTFIDIIKTVKSGVAHIQVTKKVMDRLNRSLEFQESSGSGMLVQHQGEIKVLTNKHVVEGAIDVRVTLLTGGGERKLDASIDIIDTYSDLALVKLKITDAKFLTGTKLIPIGNSDTVKEGEWVIAIGNPMGLSFTSHKGIVSAIGRSVPQEKELLPHDFIQIDANINPGNSGGPLLNLKSEAIGIINSIYSPSGFSVGIGFAIPINIAKDFLEKRTGGKTGENRAGWTGILTQAAEENLLSAYNHPQESRGLIIAKVDKGSPAHKAGLKQGDLLISMRYDGTANDITRPTDFERIISGIPPDTPIEIEFLRQGKLQKTILKVQARPV